MITVGPEAEAPPQPTTAITSSARITRRLSRVGRSIQWCGVDSGVWRGEVNRRLATDYAALFARIDLLVALEVESFEAVYRNRKLQEDKLAAANPSGVAIMDDTALDRFLMHYERLTRWMLEEVPARADVLVRIGSDKRPL